MADGRSWGEPERESMADSFARIAEMWTAQAMHSANIANAKRTMYLAFVAEGFTEAQALELVR